MNVQNTLRPRPHRRQKGNSMNFVTVVDSIMGSGKTSWAIEHMKANVEKRFFYITPLKAEDERIRDACPELHFRIPPENGRLPKSVWTAKQLRDGANVCTTHSCTERMVHNRDLLETVRDFGYTLIIDEEFPAVQEIKVHRSDRELLKQFIAVENDGKVVWTKSYPDGEWMKTIKGYAEAEQLYCYDDAFFVWEFSPDFFRAFKEVYVLTFLFKGSLFDAYFKANQISYVIKHMTDGGQLMNGEADLFMAKTRARGLIHLYDGSLYNMPENDETAYSKTWSRKRKNRDAIQQTFQNARSFLRSHCGDRTVTAIWSTYKDNRCDGDENLGRMRHRFVPCNTKATNQYRDAIALAYVVNLFLPPQYVTWARHHGVEISADVWALSMLLQWIWRSAIREGKEIHLFLPSGRMRRLLNNWLYDDYMMDDVG